MTERLDRVRGAGGGGGGKGGGGGGSQHVPVESPDSLRSRQFARVIDLVSEGEIVGLVDGLKSVTLDDVPIQNASGGYNFSGVTLVTRTGTQSQPYIPGFPSVENEVVVGTEVKYSQSVTRSFTNANLNAVRVTLGIPQLTYQNPSTGDMGGSLVQIAIDVQSNGGGYVQALTDTISGKTTSRYQRSYRVPLSGSGPWDVRVRRLTADSTQVNVQNKTWWDTATEIIDAKLRYPNSALVALQVDSAQFNHIPRRGYHLKGLIVRVPSNYDPVARSYAGTWNGTFQLAWTNNPAWVFYDLVTEARYGLGQYVDAALVDKWALYDIGRYCDELVDNGFGGTEPRFTCNLFLQKRDAAYKVVMALASVFRAMTYWGAGAITAVADKPADAVALFSPANVIGGQFGYEGSDRTQRHTVALVTWNDPADYSRQKIEYVPDETGIAKYGVQETEVVAVGCDSRGQAHRFGNWLLYTEQAETETVTFRVGLDGLSVYPGAVFQTTDPTRAGARMGGRLLASTTSQVTLDAAVTLDVGQSYTLSAVLPDGSIESRTVTTVAGTTAVLDLATPFSAAPLPHAIWVLAAGNLAPETWRCLAIEEVDATTAEVTGLAHDPAKFAAIEQGVKLETPPTSLIDTSAPAAPAGLVLSTAAYRDTSGQIGIELLASWESSAWRHEFAWRETHGNWQIGETFENAASVRPVKLGETYEISVVAINTLGRRSPAATAQTTVGSESLPTPPALATLTATGGLFDVTLVFTLTQSIWPNDVVELHEAPTNDRSGALLVAALKEPLRSFRRTGLAPGLPRYYWGRVVDAAGTLGPWYPASATAGIAATPSADPSALLTQLQGALGEDQLAAELAQPIAMIPGQQADLRRLSRNIETAAEAALNAALKVAAVDDVVNDAGIVTNPDTGEVYIYGLREAEGRLSSAELRLDGAEATINLKASVTYVDQAIATAVIDPSQIATLDDIYVRLTTAEVDIDGAQASILLKASQTEVNGIDSRLVSAEAEIDVLQGQIVLKAETTTVDTIDARLNTAEATLNTIDGASIVQSAASQRQLSRAADQAAETSLAGLLFADRNIAELATVLASAKNELYAHTNDGLAAEAGARLTLAAQVDATAAALTVEQTTRAAADSANASSIATVQARLDSGDYATVKTTAEATASALGGVQAKWGVQVQAMADGVNAVAGIQLLAGTDGESVFAILADKLLIYKPDGTGTPKQIVTLGTVNGVTALGLDGSLIVDASITATQIAAGTITAASGIIADAAITTAKIADLQVGTLQIAENAVIIPAAATGSDLDSLGTTWVDAATVTADFQSSTVFLAVSAVSDWTAASGSSSAEVDFRLLRDGLKIRAWKGTAFQTQAHTLSASLVDAPGAGAHTYTLQFKASTTLGTLFYVSTPSIIALGIRR